MNLPKSIIPRRRFLRGVGGISLSLPYLNAMAETEGKNSPSAPTRMVCVSANYGFVPSLFFPSLEDIGSSYQTPVLLEPIKEHRKDLRSSLNSTTAWMPKVGMVACMPSFRGFSRNTPRPSPRGTSAWTRKPPRSSESRLDSPVWC